MLIINGFKAFNKGLINRYGFTFKEGESYSSFGEVRFKKNGFHFCRRLEDTLRYFDGFNDIDIALVSGYGDIAVFEDDYYGYYDMFACSNIRINKVLSREEIIESMLFSNLSCDRIKRFVAGYKLNDSEIDYLLDSSDEDIIRFIKYYQMGDKDVFERVKTIK